MIGSTRYLIGDVLDKLATLPYGSVHCVVTSPPYWSLRDYGTATWEGGDEGCDHIKATAASKTSTLKNDGRPNPGSNNYEHSVVVPYHNTCGKCGATRIDQQLGLEATPEEYVAKMVEVFGEVRRVMRDDATLWLNLGSSYASSSMPPSQSHFGVPACDSDDTESQGSLNADRACPCCGGELQDDSKTHHSHTDCNNQRPEQGEPPPSQTGRDSEHQDCEEASPVASSPSSRPSTTLSSSENGQGASCHEGKASVSPTASLTSSGDGHQSERNSACIGDTVRNGGASVSRTLGMVSSCKACGYYTTTPLEFKPKDLIPIPWMVAMALQQDGYWLRDAIIWHKPSPMPGSQRDRCTSSYEFVFQLTKRARYYFDMEAVKEDNSPTSHTGGQYRNEWKYAKIKSTEKSAMAVGVPIPRNGRIPRNVWTIASEGFSEAHFATFPIELPRRCIKAGTSEKGCCPECGAGWERMVETEQFSSRPKSRPVGNSRGISASDFRAFGLPQQGSQCVRTNTIGWKPGCNCTNDVDGWPIPCTVLDPFGGAGTVALAANQIGRDSIYIDLNPDYADMAQKRVAKGLRPGTYRDENKVVDAPLFTEREVE